MIRFILLGLMFIMIARAFWKMFDAILEGAGGTPRTRRAATPSMRLVRDPVCGMHVSPAASVTLAIGTTTHYFCSEACRDRFRKTA